MVMPRSGLIYLARGFSMKMIFRLVWVIGVLVVLTKTVLSKPVPDSAGIVPLPDGLAYGGIPYGSVSGQLSLYFGEYDPVLVTNKVNNNDLQLL